MKYGIKKIICIWKSEQCYYSMKLMEASGCNFWKQTCRHSHMKIWVFYISYPNTWYWFSKWNMESSIIAIGEYCYLFSYTKYKMLYIELEQIREMINLNQLWSSLYLSSENLSTMFLNKIWYSQYFNATLCTERFAIQNSIWFSIWNSLYFIYQSR